MYTPLTGSQIAEHFKIGNSLARMRGNQFFGECHPLVCEAYKKWGLEGHNGIDLRAKTGTEVRAVCDGTVVEAGVDSTGGILVKYQSRNIKIGEQIIKLEFLEYHLQLFKVAVGDKIKKGQLIALSDNTGGVSTGAHCHQSMKPMYRQTDDHYIKDYNNGYKGAVDHSPLFLDQSWLPNSPDNPLYYENRFIKHPESSRVWLVLGLTRRHVPNEDAFWLRGRSLDNDIETYSKKRVEMIPESEPLVDPIGVTMTTKKMKQILLEAKRYGKSN